MHDCFILYICIHTDFALQYDIQIWNIIVLKTDNMFQLHNNLQYDDITFYALAIATACTNESISTFASSLQTTHSEQINKTTQWTSTEFLTGYKFGVSTYDIEQETTSRIVWAKCVSHRHKGQQQRMRLNLQFLTNMTGLQIYLVVYISFNLQKLDILYLTTKAELFFIHHLAEGLHMADIKMFNHNLGCLLLALT